MHLGSWAGRGDQWSAEAQKISQELPANWPTKRLYFAPPVRLCSGKLRNRRFPEQMRGRTAFWGNQSAVTDRLALPRGVRPNGLGSEEG